MLKGKEIVIVNAAFSETVLLLENANLVKWRRSISSELSPTVRRDESFQKKKFIDFFVQW